jgi:hypothetical protein
MRNQRLILSGLTLLGSAVAVIVLAGGTGASAQAPVPASPAQPAARAAAIPVHQETGAQIEQRAFMKQYCQTCHNAKLKTADLALDTLDLTDISKSGETMEKVVRKVWSRSMPPAQAPQPDKAKADAFLASLRVTLDSYAMAHPNPGRPTMLHRLNRTEYLNAVKDLFKVELTPDEMALLPPDDLSYGFDNNGDVLGIPPLLLERYLSVARKVAIAALGTPAKDNADIAVYTQREEFGGPLQAQWREGLPLGTRGGTAFTYRFPADGEYSIKIKLQRRNSRILGFPAAVTTAGDEPLVRQRIAVGLDGKTVGLFLIGADQTIQEQVPSSEEGLADLPEPPEKVLPIADANNRGFNADDNMEFKFHAKAGNRQVTAAFLAKYAPLPSQIREPYAAGTGGPPAAMSIYSVAVTGPFKSEGPGDTQSRRRIFSCHPASPAEESTCAKNILTTLARNAYRRPATQPEMQELLTAYERGRKSGDFEAGFELAFRRMLMDPAFLFRMEQEPAKIAPGTPYRLNDLELASRLSFFLWSSSPDNELLAVAEKGQLKDAVLEHQVRRMLADPRAKSVVTNFASEWLGLRTVQGAQPDPVLFSDFDGLKAAFTEETELLLKYVLLGDRNMLELLDSKYTFVNERLAKHYGIPNIYGDQFRKVAVTDGIRGGLLGQGGILTATSYPNRTSVVLRGKWILDNLIGSPPPPPPPNVPPLPEENSGKVLSMREKMAEHRKNPACASCHARMDPLGFALENFDATGKWRGGESAALGDLSVVPIDATGQLTDGTKFDGIIGLKKVLLQDHSEEFVYTLTERLLVYALGRGNEGYDAPTIRAAVRAARKDEYHFSTLVLNLVKSPAFQMRMSRSTEEARESTSAQPKLTASK